ncbi:MAG: tetratricopeptide repeat protein, partial [Rhodospirillales bacterium]|nr:tetratricopeptide repeat protein [Rhodospirillales bacterium]
PFDNLSGDEAQEYIGDGLTENVIAVLSTSPYLFVIALDTANIYKGKAAKIQQVAEQMGVRYVLNGSVLLSGDKIRVTARLVDALNGKHLWVERYNRQLDDLFELYDDIANKIAQEMKVKLTIGETARSWLQEAGNPENLRIWLDGRKHFQKFNSDGHRKAEAIWSKFHERNPELSTANSQMGWVHWQKVVIGITKDRKKDLELAGKFAEKALTISESPTNLVLAASLDVLQRKHESAIAHVDRILEIAPSSSTAHTIGAWVKSVSGQPAEAVKMLRRGMRLQPTYAPLWPRNLAETLMELGQYDEAKRIAEGLLGSARDNTRVSRKLLTMLAAMAVFQDDLNSAREYVKRILEIAPKANVAGFKKALYYLKNQEYLTRYAQALVKAGLPEKPPSAEPKKPAIAVLPFANLSDDKAQEYFADGMTDDLITDLSKLSGLIVIARNSVFTYKGKAVKVQDVAKDLNVTHVLEGSVRRAGGKVRINAQLIDAKTGAHLWADKFDRDFGDIFALQDAITGKIVRALAVTLTSAEQALAEQLETTVPEAYDAFLAGWRHFQLRTVADYRKALVWLNKAVALDPEYSRAWAALASLYKEALDREWTSQLGIDATKLSELLAKALQRPTALAHRVEADVLVFQNRLDDAMSAIDKASALDPNDAETYVFRSFLVAAQGDAKTAIALMKTAMRLDPHYPAFNLYVLGTHYQRAGDFAKAIELLERARARNPDDWWPLVYLTAAYAQAERLEDARRAAKALIAHRKELGHPTTAVDNFSLMMFPNDPFGEKVLAGLRKSGIPDKLNVEKPGLPPEDRFSEAEMRELQKSGHRK